MSARIRERLAGRPVIGDGPVGTAGTWRVPVGWVRLDDQAVWHRPHPERPDQVMCELPVPVAASVYQRRVTTEPVCPDCHTVRTQALMARVGRSVNGGTIANPTCPTYETL